jgi:hypothetical protein
MNNSSSNRYVSKEPGMKKPDAVAYKCDDSERHINYKNWPWTKNSDVDLSGSNKYTSEPTMVFEHKFRQGHDQLFQQYHKCLSDTKCEIECDKYLNKAVLLDSRFKDSLY